LPTHRDLRPRLRFEDAPLRSVEDMLDVPHFRFGNANDQLTLSANPPFGKPLSSFQRNAAKIC
jgi:hypothetical protein